MDERAKIDVGLGVGIVMGISVVALVIAFVLPVAMSAYYDGSTSTYNQSVGETLELQTSLNGTLDSTDAANDTITVTVSDGADSESNTISANANATYSINGESITVTNENEVQDSYATVTYEYPTTYGWGSGESTLFKIVPLLLALTVFLLIVGYGIAGYRQA